jgi:hypothetical protein
LCELYNSFVFNKPSFPQAEESCAKVIFFSWWQKSPRLSGPSGKRTTARAENGRESPRWVFHPQLALITSRLGLSFALPNVAIHAWRSEINFWYRLLIPAGRTRRSAPDSHYYYSTKSTPKFLTFIDTPMYPITVQLGGHDDPGKNKATSTWNGWLS